MKTIKIIPLKNPVTRDVKLPGSLSYTIRALNLAALTRGNIKILNPLISDDTQTMLGVLKTLGISFEEGKNKITIHGDISQIKDEEYEINVGISGRTARTILATLCIVPGVKTVRCDEAFKKRPIGDLVEGLKRLGAKIEYLEKKGFLPVKISSSRLHSGVVRINGEKSSQYVSALLMVAPLIEGITIEVIGEQASKPFIDITIDAMKQFGVNVINKDYKKFIVDGNQMYKNPREFAVEPDATAASYFFAIAALTKSKIKVVGLNSNSKQGDIKFAGMLVAMGCTVQKDKGDILVKGTNKLNGITIDMNDTPDVVQTLAILAAFAKGKTHITSVGHLKIKETDRIDSTKRELEKMGIKVDATEDSLTIHGGSPHGATIDTHGDHRIAMAFAVAGTKIPGIMINDPDVVGKSFPDFWEKLKELGLSIKPASTKNIVLIGMRGSGKTTIARLLSKKIGKEAIELDDVLIKRVGMSIPEIIEKRGWNFFREKESKIVQEISGFHDKVISTGGGVVTRGENIETLKKNGVVVFLKASPKTLVSRLGESPTRPRLTDRKSIQDEMEVIFKERKDVYEEAADLIIDTDRFTIEEVVNKIVEKNL